MILLTPLAILLWIFVGLVSLVIVGGIIFLLVLLIGAAGDARRAKRRRKAAQARIASRSGRGHR